MRFNVYDITQIQLCLKPLSLLRAVLQQCILCSTLVFTRASLFPWKLLPQPGRLSHDHHIGINADKNTSAV